MDSTQLQQTIDSLWDRRDTVSSSTTGADRDAVEAALALLDSGAMAQGPSALVGVAIGSEALYKGLDHPHFQFRPVNVTHDPATLADIERLVTINSAMEVDLFGQVFAEASSRGFQSGPGGAGDFARGARRSPGGIRIIALPAEAGGISRIVAPGAGHGPVFSTK